MENIEIIKEAVYITGDTEAFFMKVGCAYEEEANNMNAVGEAKFWKTVLGVVKYAILNYGGFNSKLRITLPNKKVMILHTKKSCTYRLNKNQKNLCTN